MKNINFNPSAMKLIHRRAWVMLFLLFGCLGTALAQITIKGTIVDGFKEPLAGVTVSIKNTTQGTLSDIDGNFSINVASAKDVLVFSYIGFNKQEIVVGNRTTLNITLLERSELLDEVVVVGYGTMKKKDLTGAIGMVNAEELAKEQPKSIQDMIRTGIPGLSMGISTSAKGNAGGMLIRGKNSFRDSNEPLLVLDGVIYYGELTDINPDDVERIDVLKDASSAAVYGAKAANGVILVTTKKGKEGKPTIKFSTTVGAAFRNSLPKTYKGKEYINYRQDVMESQNRYSDNFNKDYFKDPSGFTNNSELEEWLALDNSSEDPTTTWLTRLQLSPIEIENYRNNRVVDWERLTYHTALQQDYSLSVSGKKDETNYYTSMNYVKNEGNVRGSGYSAIRARLNLESKATKYITYGINTQFTSRDEGYVGVGGTGYRTVSPYGNVYDENGNYTYYVNDNNNQYNPLIDAHYTSRRNDINNLNASLYLRVNLPYGFSVQSTYAPRFQWINYMNHKSSEHPLWENISDTAIRSNSKQFFWQWDNTLKWNKTYGKHALDFTFLLNWEQLKNWSDRITNSAFLPSDVLGPGGIEWGTSPKVTSNDNVRTGDAVMGRFHYVYDNRYLVTATVRRDGYSAFGGNNPRANFPSLALGWVFSEEGFFNNDSWFNYGKLRFSWGKNGNRDVGMYDALMMLDPRKYYYVDPITGETTNINTYYAYRMANKDLKWESTDSYNIGLDYSLLNDRITGSFDVYRKNTKDLIVNRLLPDITGYASVVSNIGEIQNTGFEMSINTMNFKEDNFQWSTNFGLSYNKNKIKKLYGLMETIYDDAGNVIGQREADDIANQRFIGKSMDVIWDYKIDGVWQEDEAEEAKKYGLYPGDFKLRDTDGSGTYSDKDRVFQGSKVPKVRLSMRNSFTLFKNITFSFNIYSYLGQYKAFNRAKNDGALLNTTNQIKNEYWTPENRSNKYARLSAKSPVGFNVWRKADFVRLENISLGYQFPKSMLKKVNIQALNVNMTIKNLTYISNWPGEDPENSGANTPRSVYFGLNVTL